MQETESLLSAEKEHALQLENELEDQTNSHYQAIETFKNELEEEKVKNKEKDEKVIFVFELLVVKCVCGSRHIADNIF